jgi:glyoxylate reductase
MPAKPRVFVSRRIPQVGIDLISPHCDAEVWSDLLPPPADTLRQKIRDCVGLISLLTDRIDGSLMDAAPNLKVVSNFAVGFNNVDVAAATKRGIRVGNTPGVLTDATADIAITLMLAATRRLGESTQDAREGRWLTWDPLFWLGQTWSKNGWNRRHTDWIQFLRKSCTRGEDTLFIRTYIRILPPKPHSRAARRSRHSVMRSGFRICTCRSQSQTKGLFGKIICQMKPTAVFINTARGPMSIRSRSRMQPQQDDLRGGARRDGSELIAEGSRIAAHAKLYRRRTSPVPRSIAKRDAASAART